MIRRTKILCTIGPASDSRQMLRKLIKAGMDGVRINFSHGTNEEHGKVIETVRQLSKEVRKPVAVVIDLQGPKSRIGDVEEGGVFLKPGHGITITTKKVLGSEGIVPTQNLAFPEEVRAGDEVLLSDGQMCLKVQKVRGNEVDCIVLRGGILQSHKGMNYRARESKRGLTEKDWNDLKFGIEHEVDFVAISFVRTAKDVTEVRKFCEAKGSKAHLIAKIEKAEAVENINQILNVADGIMIARGDLGVEIPIEDMPLVQKNIIARCAQSSRIVITATQMLESMTWNPTPTRAEVLDIANAVLDGTDVLMLSGETAVGKYPVEVVKMMARVAARAEKESPWDPKLHSDLRENLRITNTVGHAAATIASNIGAKGIIAFTMGGSTARVISKYRPQMPILALSPDSRAVRRMALYRGVEPRTIENTEATDDMIALVERTLKRGRLMKNGDLCVITAGVPLSTEGMSNLIKVHRVGSGRWPLLSEK
jgi:pyruvate kinase